METLTCRGSVKSVMFSKWEVIHSHFFGSLELEIVVYSGHVDDV
jgi:hypothetical protein